MGQRISRNYLKIIQVGNSDGIIIPKKMLVSIGVARMDYVFVTIEKLDKSELSVRLKKIKMELN
jgi:antitoxin component of MazEF toxin-antitoxin module